VAVVERRQRVHYAWVVFAVAFFTLLAAAGFRAAPGVLILPLQDEFGWSRATISSAISVNLILFGLSGPFAAALMGRYGLRRVVASALATIAAGAALTTQIHAPWQLVALWGVVVGAGSGCMATVFAATVANRWFVERRGIVTGALTAATATGQLAFLPALAWLAEGRGWRWVSISIAVAALAGVPVLAMWLRDKPEDVGVLAYGAPEGWSTPPPTAHPVGAALDGLRVAVRTPAFLLLAGSFFVCGASTNGLVGTHFIAAAVDSGISSPRAGALLAAVGVFDIVGTIASGWLTDRIDPRRLLFVYYGLRGVALLFLHHVLSSRGIGLVGFMVFYGLDWVATVPPTVALCTEVFGQVRGGVVYGWVFASHQIGAAAAAYAAGATRGSTGSYELAFHVAALLCLLAALGTEQVRRGSTPLVGMQPAASGTGG
jgi:MFS family permease